MVALFRDLRPATAAPALGLPAYPLDLGFGKSGEVVRGSFELRNTGAAPLKFAIDGSCACASLEPSEGTISSGSILPIAIGIRLDKMKVEQHVYLNIKSNDPRRALVTYSVTARCPQLITFAPAVIDFGIVPHESSSTITLQIIPDAATHIGDADISVTHSSPYITIDRSRLNTHREIQITLLGTAPRGYINEFVHVALSGDAYSADVPVLGFVRGAISVAPAHLYFRRDNDTGEAIPARLIVWRPDHQPLGRLMSASVPSGFRIEEETSTIDLRRRFVVIPALAEAPLASLQIELRFESVDETLSVPLHISSN